MFSSIKDFFKEIKDSGETIEVSRHFESEGFISGEVCFEQIEFTDDDYDHDIEIDNFKFDGYVKDVPVRFEINSVTVSFEEDSIIIGTEETYTTLYKK